MFFKKNKKEDSFTPRDLEAFERDLALHGAIRNESASLVKDQKRKRKAAIILLILLILILLFFNNSVFIALARSVANCSFVLFIDFLNGSIIIKKPKNVLTKCDDCLILKSTTEEKTQ